MNHDKLLIHITTPYPFSLPLFFFLQRDLDSFITIQTSVQEVNKNYYGKISCICFCLMFHYSLFHFGFHAAVLVLLYKEEQMPGRFAFKMGKRSCK